MYVSNFFTVLTLPEITYWKDNCLATQLVFLTHEIHTFCVPVSRMFLLELFSYCLLIWLLLLLLVTGYCAVVNAQLIPDLRKVIISLLK